MSREYSKTKCIRFNLKNPAEKRIYDYLESIDSFSTLIKHLVTNHLASGWSTINEQPKRKEEEKKKIKKKITKGIPIFDEDE